MRGEQGRSIVAPSSSQVNIDTAWADTEPEALINHLQWTHTNTHTHAHVVRRTINTHKHTCCVQNPCSNVNVLFGKARQQKKRNIFISCRQKKCNVWHCVLLKKFNLIMHSNSFLRTLQSKQLYNKSRLIKQICFQKYHFAHFMCNPAWQIMAAITLLLIISERKQKTSSLDKQNN